MNKEIRLLSDLKISQSALIVKVNVKGKLRQHLLDMGIIPGVKLTLERFAPLGDPMVIRIFNYAFAIRKEDAKNIEVIECDIIKNNKLLYINKFYDKHKQIHQNNKMLFNNTLLKFALVGNQNCGKTTLFNELTGSNQKVGNFPGVTIDRKDGKVKNHHNILITDLPGIYSLSPYTSEEIISREFILKENLDGVINVIDITNIERNLYLTLQLLELNIPLIIALNMMDEFKKNRGYIDIYKMEKLLGVQLIPISAKKSMGIKELINVSSNIKNNPIKKFNIEFYLKDKSNLLIYKLINEIMALVEDKVKKYHLPILFTSIKIVEGDKWIFDTLKLNETERSNIEYKIFKIEEKYGFDRNIIIANMRYKCIKKICDECLIKPNKSKEQLKTERFDNILTGKYFAFPSFILVIGLIFFFTFNVIGKALQDLCDFCIKFLSDKLNNFFQEINVNPIVCSFVTEGIFIGVGNTLSFMPIIIVFFFFLSILEDSGYMARIAFIMDKPLRKIGLSGKSIVSLLIGFGCSVPGVMSTRTLSTESDRKKTVLLLPFMSCSAKLPIYSFFAYLFFRECAWLIMLSLYLLGIFMCILEAIILNIFIDDKEPFHFNIELPNYRMISLKNVFQLLYEKIKDFLQKVFGVILMSTIIIWFLKSFDYHLNFINNPSDSILALIANFISPIFIPLGFNDYRIITSLISGILAKEAMISTLSVLFISKESFLLLFNKYQIYCLLVFFLLYTPCIATLSSIKRELGVKYMFIVACFQLLCAYIVSLLFSILFHGLGVI